MLRHMDFKVAMNINVLIFTEPREDRESNLKPTYGTRAGERESVLQIL